MQTEIAAGRQITGGNWSVLGSVANSFKGEIRVTTVRWAAVAALLLVFGIPTAVRAAVCDNPTSSAEVARCVGEELRTADAKINVTYKALMGKLGDAGRKELRDQQRAWIKDRDRECNLDSKESDRERWYRALQTDYVKTVCVTRYTRRREAELQAMLEPPPAASHPSKASGRDSSKVDTPKKPESSTPFKPTLREKGKWYFEVAIDYARVVDIGPCVITAGVSDLSMMVGILENVRARDAVKSPKVFGFAVDLDEGKLYVSENGQWTDGEPGSNRGTDVKLGIKYYSIVRNSADDMLVYFDKGAIRGRWGDTPMEYALPAGYRPWRDTLSQ
jgi:uncharacterized protein YecT (DUF1311 family)